MPLHCLLLKAFAGACLQVASSAAMALGHIAFGDTSPATLHLIVPALLSIAGTKAQNFMFSAGEAISLAFGGEPSALCHCTREMS